MRNILPVYKELGVIAIVLFLAVSCSVLCGCSTPPTIIEAEDKSIEMLKNYYDNIDAIIDALITAYLEAEYAHNDSLMEHDLTLQQDEDGDVPVEIVKKILEAWRKNNKDSEAEANKLRVYKEKADKDFVRALELQKHIREWAAQKGVDPAEIDRFTEMLNKQFLED